MDRQLSENPFEILKMLTELALEREKHGESYLNKIREYTDVAVFDDRKKMDYIRAELHTIQDNILDVLDKVTAIKRHSQKMRDKHK